MRPSSGLSPLAFLPLYFEGPTVLVLVFGFDRLALVRGDARALLRPDSSLGYLMRVVPWLSLILRS